MSSYILVFLTVLASNATASSQNAPPVTKDIGATVEAITGLKVSRQGSQVKLSLPQNDLHVRLEGWSITPPMGLSSWAAFVPTHDGAIMMGDFVLQANEIAPVERLLADNGLTFTGLHNHFVGEEPRLMFMHIHGEGAVEPLSKGVKALIDKIRELRGSTAASSSSPSVSSSLPAAQLENEIGQHGEMAGGVLRFVIGRPDVKLESHGVEVTSFMGFNTWAAFQGTADRAAVAGDFAMLENEVEPVIAALTRNGIEVVAVHNHMVHEDPRIFFLHYWGVGPAQKLAAGLREALAQTGGGASHSHAVSSAARHDK